MTETTSGNGLSALKQASYHLLLKLKDVTRETVIQDTKNPIPDKDNLGWK